MNALTTLYGGSLALLTDLYQLTMAYGYWRSGMAERETAFHAYFRTNPFGGGFALACGLHALIEHIEALRFEGEDLAYLASLVGHDGEPLFAPPFLDSLRRLELRVDIDAVPEGTVVFPQEPLVRVVGPALACQLLETPLLALINFQTLVATRAARVCRAARGEPVLEFGLRRAQGIDGAISAARAAYVGGCAATSNVLAGRLFGIPVRGTHAHSWVMLFEDELEAFRRYADAMPNNCVFLVDTYNSLRGVEHAIEVARELRARGHEMVGIRLDSGDLAHLSVETRRMLDQAGFPDASILASSDLDEHIIASLKDQGAAINVWGVGTRLVTAYEQPALDGVYKLSAVRGEDGRWRHKLKLSENPAKISTPGILQVRRYFEGGEISADVIYNAADGGTPSAAGVMYDVNDPTWRRTLPAAAEHRDLLVPVLRAGRRVYDPPPLEQVRAHAAAELGRLSPRVKRFANPQIHPVGLDPDLHQLKLSLIARARGDSP